MDNIKWVDSTHEKLRLSGFAFYEKDKIFRRLPLSSKELFEVVNNNLNELCEHTSGGQISFSTTSRNIYVSVELLNMHHMNNMPATGQCGFDCYVRYEGDEYKFFGVSQYDITQKSYTVPLCQNLLEGKKDIIINFPLYQGVKTVKIAIDCDCEILEPKPYSLAPMLFYGTSITQGGCATRPGMSHVNILSRKFNCEVYNFGFSANGLGEYEMAEIIADISPLSLICLDYEANAGSNGRLEKSLEGFIEIIRKKQPLTPILVVSRIAHTNDFYNKDAMSLRNRLRKFQKNVVKERNSQGDNNIYFYNGYNLIGKNCHEYTVDFIHPTDLGFVAIANGLYKQIDKILKVKGI